MIDSNVGASWAANEIAAIKLRVLALETSLQTLSGKLDGIGSGVDDVLSVLKGARTIGGFIYTNWGKIGTVIFAIATSQHWLNPTILAAIQSSFLPH